MSVFIDRETGRRGEEEKERGERDTEPSLSVLPFSLAPPDPLPIQIRAYRSADYTFVLRLWEEANLRPFTEIEMERLLTGGGAALVAVQQADGSDSVPSQSAGIRRACEAPAANPTAQEQIVGVVLWSHNGSIGILWRLAVAEIARGQGLATRLLDRAEHDIRAFGLSGVSLLTRVNNTIAKGMYARRGYRWNDHLEFWGKKLPAVTEEAADSAENARPNAKEEEGAADRSDDTGCRTGGHEPC